MYTNATLSSMKSKPWLKTQPTQEDMSGAMLAQVVCEGFLSKANAKFRKKRYFVLRENGCLYYYDEVCNPWIGKAINDRHQRVICMHTKLSRPRTGQGLKAH